MYSARLTSVDHIDDLVVLSDDAMDAYSERFLHIITDARGKIWGVVASCCMNYASRGGGSWRKRHRQSVARAVAKPQQ